MKSKSILRRAERADLDKIVSWMQDPDYMHFLYGDPARSPRQVRENIVSMLGRNQGTNLPGSIHLVIDHADLGPIGLVSLQKISWRNRACNIDFYIGDKGSRNRIEPTVAMYRVAEFCFDELNLHRIGAYIYSFNAPSWRLLERCGARRELTLRDHVMRDGKLCDMYCYGLLRRDFNAFKEELSVFKSLSLEAMIERLNAETSPPGEGG